MTTSTSSCSVSLPLADAASLLATGLVILPWILALTLWSYAFALVGLGSATCHLLIMLLKTICATTVSDAFKRPPGACNCGSFNGGSRTYAGKQGFPSGHAAHATCSLALMMALIPSLRTPAFAMLAVAIIAAVAAARLVKRCHTPLQVCAGVLTGAAWAAAFYCLVRVTPLRLLLAD